MKILYLIPFSKKENAFIFSRRECSTSREFFFNQTEIHQVKYTGGIFLLIKSLFDLRRKINTENYDIVHAQYGTITAFLGTLVTFKKKYVITFRGGDLNGHSDVHIVRKFSALFLSWFAMKFADAVIYVSAPLKERSPRLCHRWEVIPTGVDSLFQPMDQKTCRKELKLDENKKYLLFYSSFNSPNKRPDLAYGAVGYLQGKGFEDIELLVLDGRIPPDMMPVYLNAADAVLMLSDKEGSPTIVQEALACGTRIVSVDVGDTKEVLARVDNAIIVERSVKSIAEGVQYVLTRERKVSVEAEKYKLQHCVSRILALYQRVLTE